jgi:hypothetical protein
MVRRLRVEIARMPTSRAATWPRQVVLAATRALLAFVVVAGIVHSGARYFYCEALGLADVDPCLRGSSARGAPCPVKALEESHADCCDIIRLPSVPSGTGLEGPRVHPAAVLALVPAALDGHRVFDDAPRAGALAFERWRIPPRSAGRARARLMVFLT